MRRQRGDATPGMMRQNVIIQRPTVTTDALGDYAESHATILTAPAAIEPRSGIEETDAKQISASITHRVTTRWLSEIAAMSPEWRLLVSRHDSPETFRSLDIVEVLNPETANRFLVMMCVERQPAEAEVVSAAAVNWEDGSTIDWEDGETVDWES